MIKWWFIRKINNLEFLRLICKGNVRKRISYFAVRITINSFLFVIVLNRCMIWKIVLIATPITHAWNDSTYKFGHAIYDIRLNIAFHTKICVVKNQVGTWKYVNVCLVSLNIIKHIMHVPLKGEYSSVYIL